MLPGSTLWKRIEEFRLDAPEAEFPFSSKLRRETGWDPTYVQLAIQEYKKFTYLACVAGHPVSPSKDVDEVWHLHLTYTRSYWEDFCPNVLERPLHHEPSSGGADEDAKYQDWYARTLESYERIFEEPAPEWIWPRAVNRDGVGEPRKEKDMSRWCGLLKALSGAYPAFLKKRFIAAFFGLFLIGGCASNGAAPDPFDYRGPEFLVFYWTLAVFSLLGAWIWQGRNLFPEDDGGEFSEDEPYLAARLARNDTRPLKAALVSLQSRRVVAVSAKGRVYRVPLVPPPTDELERAIWNHAGEDGIEVRQLWANLAAEMKRLDAELILRGLLLSQKMRDEAHLGFGISGGVLLLVGAAKCVIGLNRDKPITFLVMSMLVLGVIHVCILVSNHPRQTRRGEAYLRRLKSRIDEKVDIRIGETATLILAVALMGDAFLPGEIKTAFAAAFPGGGGNGGGGCGGGGCGGGGCGGGCGGCGGG